MPQLVLLEFILIFIISVVLALLLPKIFPARYRSYPKPVKNPDECGKIDYGVQSDVNIGVQYSPLVVASEAIRLYEVFSRRNDSELLERFIKCINILESLVDDRGSYAVIQYKFPWPRYGIKGPWASCMSQADGVLAFYYAYRITGDSKYKVLANKLLRAFLVPVEQGGLMWETEAGPWYEEYAYPEPTSKPFVLNGFMYSLIKLYEYYKTSGDRRALDLFGSGVKTLKHYIGKFDLGRWTKYDLVGTTATYPKHLLHIRFSKRLYEITSDRAFLDYYRKWRNQLYTFTGIRYFVNHYKSVIFRRYLQLPIFHKFAINLIVLLLLLLVAKYLV